MTTPDSIKYAHTPSATDNVWGVGLKDAKRQSKCTARLDVAQSVTGLILGIFLFCHMGFTGSVNFGKDLFANLIGHLRAASGLTVQTTPGCTSSLWASSSCA